MNPTYRVATLDGNPLPRGTVAFNPQGLGPSAYGRIESNGEYAIHTGREEGLPPGQYLLTVVANEAPTEEGTVVRHWQANRSRRRGIDQRKPLGWNLLSLQGAIKST